MERLLTLEEIQYIENNILLKFDFFCRKHNLKFYLNWGTLIGAVRHKGVIPWDDDIDVVMSLSDYKKLCNLKNIFDREMKKHHLKMQSPFDTEQGIYAWGCHIYDTRTSYKEKIGLVSPGICIDVSFFSLAPGNKLACYLYGIKKHMYYWLHCFKHDMQHVPKNYFKRIIKSCIRPMFNHIPNDYFYNKILYQDMYEYNNFSSYIWEPLAILANIPYDKLIWRREWFDKTVKLEFNKSMYEAPQKYHEILTMIYGDYMQVPPYEQRQQLHAHGGAYIKTGEIIEGLGTNYVL